MNFDALNQKLLRDAPAFLHELLPGGKIQGHEYTCASLFGGKGKSVSVNIQNGKWGEFAGDEKGSDLISLFAEIKGMSQGEAYLALGGERDSDASFKHPQFGLPQNLWYYNSPAGIPILVVGRYKDGIEKTYLPWIPNGNGWKTAYPKPPRPLYGLDVLASRPMAPVLIVEGEKAAEAAKTLAPDFVVITWPSGAKAWSKADWKPVFGRSNVVLWPDADNPGIDAVTGISQILHPSCGTLKILNVSDQPLAWDAADAVTDGWTKEKVYEWIGNTTAMVPSFSFKSQTIAELLSLPEPSIEWMIESLWTDKSRGLVAGNPGVGKTWLAMDMLFSVATGQMCLGRFKPAFTAPVLLIEEEASVLNLSRRVHALARARCLQDSNLTNFHHITRQFLKILIHKQELVSFIKTHGIRFVVFDSLRRFHGVDENSSEKMQPVLDAFAQLGIETDASILLIHHLSKQGNAKEKKPIFERLRGTSDLWAWRDCLLAVDGEPDSLESQCSFQFRDAESPLPILIKRNVDKTSGAISLSSVGIEEAEENADKIEKITSYLRTQFYGATQDAIHAAIKGRKQENIRIVKLMAARGLLVKNDGKWIVPEMAGTIGNDGN